jgi:hypothetical protein
MNFQIIIKIIPIKEILRKEYSEAKKNVQFVIKNREKVLKYKSEILRIKNEIPKASLKFFAYMVAILTTMDLIFRKNFFQSLTLGMGYYGVTMSPVVLLGALSAINSISGYINTRESLIQIMERYKMNALKPSKEDISRIIRGLGPIAHRAHGGCTFAGVIAAIEDTFPKNPSVAEDVIEGIK